MLQYVTTVKQYIMTTCLSNRVWKHIANKHNRQTVLFPRFNGRLLKCTIGEKYVFSHKGKQDKKPQKLKGCVAF